MKLSSRSKKINKNDMINYFREQCMKYPKEWRQIQLLREQVKARHWDLKYAEFRLEKKLNKFHHLIKPASPQVSYTSSS